MIVKDGVLIKVENSDIVNGTFSSWKGITSIGESAFSSVQELTHIKIPRSVKKIGKDCFNSCFKLKKVILPNSVETIEEGTFYNCCTLEKVKLPRSLKKIEKSAFEECVYIKQITMPKNVTEIGKNAFKKCSNLEKIKLSQKLSSIADDAFSFCQNLYSIDIPNSVTELGENAFFECVNLRNIILSEGIEKIKKHTFYGCNHIRSLHLSDSIKEIEKYAFENCSISYLYLSKNLEIIDRAAFLRSFVYICVKNGNEYNTYDITKQFGHGYSVYEETETIIFLNKANENFSIPKTIKFPLSFLTNLNKEEMNKVIQPDSYKHFKSIFDIRSLDPYSIEVAHDFYKFAYVLGCFSNEETIIDGKKVNVSQKASVFLKQALDEYYLAFATMHDLFDNLKVQKYNVDLLKFITHQEKVNGQKQYTNLNYLLSSRRKMSTIINNFDKIMKTVVTDEKGRVLQNPSVKKRIETYLSKNVFENIEEGNEDIVKEFAKFPAVRQEDFEKAQEIRKNENKKHHIVDSLLKEETIIESIEKIKNEIDNKTIDSKKLLDELYELEFTYEWLDKHDPKNFVLGLYCDCCASIVSHAYGKEIMEASIVRDDVQNLVIKDDKGQIVAKATIYVNKEKGYAVFNDIEMNRSYGNEVDEDDKSDNKQREKIYKAFKRGVKAFVDKYNEINTKKPITQVNVGWGFNRLKQIIRKYEKKSDELLDVVDSFQDAKEEQWIVYKK